MLCRICNKEIDVKFYRHLNSIHKMKKEEYLAFFPDQREEYDLQVPNVWNKGQTRETNPIVADIASKLKTIVIYPT